MNFQTQRHEGEPQRHEQIGDLIANTSPYPPFPDQTERFAAEIVDAAFTVHSALDPGLLESVYETCLCHELMKRGIPVSTQVAVPIVYDGIRLGFPINFNVARIKQGIQRMIV